MSEMRKGTWLAVIAVATAAVYLGTLSRPASESSRLSAHADDASGEQNDLAGTPMNITRLPRASSEIPVAAQSLDAASVYDSYKEKKICLMEGMTPAELLASISDLKNGINRVGPELREFFDREIRGEEELLPQLNKCASEKRPVTQDELRDLLATAARLGNIDAQMDYAKDPEIDPFHAIANLDHLREWHDSALNYVTAAANSGNARAMLLLAAAADPFQCEASNDLNCAGLLSYVVAQDAEDSYRDYYLLQLANPAGTPGWVATEMSALETLLSPVDIAKAKLDARTKYRDQPGRR